MPSLLARPRITPGYVRFVSDAGLSPLHTAEARHQSVAPDLLIFFSTLANGMPRSRPECMLSILEPVEVRPAAEADYACLKDRGANEVGCVAPTQIFMVGMEFRSAYCLQNENP